MPITILDEGSYEASLNQPQWLVGANTYVPEAWKCRCNFMPNTNFRLLTALQRAPWAQWDSPYWEMTFAPIKDLLDLCDGLASGFEYEFCGPALLALTTLCLHKALYHEHECRNSDACESQARLVTRKMSMAVKLYSGYVLPCIRYTIWPLDAMRLGRFAHEAAKHGVNSSPWIPQIWSSHRTAFSTCVPFSFAGALARARRVGLQIS